MLTTESTSETGIEERILAEEKAAKWMDSQVPYVRPLVLVWLDAPHKEWLAGT